MTRSDKTHQLLSEAQRDREQVNKELQVRGCVTASRHTHCSQNLQLVHQEVQQRAAQSYQRTQQEEHRAAKFAGIANEH